MRSSGGKLDLVDNFCGEKVLFGGKCSVESFGGKCSVELFLEEMPYLISSNPMR